MTGPAPLDDLPPEGRVLRRAVLLRRYENALARAVGRILSRAYADLEAILRRQPPDGVTPGRQARRLQSLAAQADTVLRDAYRDLATVTRTQLQELSRISGDGAVREVETRLRELGVDASPLRLPTRAEFTTMVVSDPIQGAPLGDWWAQQSATARTIFRREVQLGVTRRETVDQIVRRIRGLVLRRGEVDVFAGGAFGRSLRDATTLVRTAVHQINNDAAMLAYRRNADVLRGVEFVATIDERTCPQCGPLDGRVWPLDDPALQQPPLHPNCRCTVVPVTLNQRRRDRLTYPEWFAKQPAAVQDRIVGKRRGAIARKLGLDFTELVRRDGNFLTLEQLATRYPAAT